MSGPVSVWAVMWPQRWKATERVANIKRRLPSFDEFLKNNVYLLYRNHLTIVAFSSFNQFHIAHDRCWLM